MLPDDIGSVCLGLRTRRAARAVSRAYNARLRPLSLQLSQFALLVSIRRGEDFSIEKLAERLDVEASALLRNLKVLESGGLVQGEGGRGRRGRRLSLTETGARLLETAAPIWARTQADLTEAMGGAADEALATLARLETAAQQLERSRQ
jgi:DNA-binding MarR family transcriptional regulator